MQQVTNILLPKAANNNASIGKASAQDTNSEDFSAALASVSTVSPSTKKSSTSQDPAIQSTKSASTNDVSQDEDDDVSLIFAQIGMANEMKKTAAQGDKLPPQETNLDTATFAAETVINSWELSSEAESNFSSELDKLAELSLDVVPADELDLALTAESNITKLPEVESTLATSTVETDLTTLAMHNGAVTSHSSEEQLEQDVLVGDEENTIELVSQEGAKQQKQGVVDALPIMDVESDDVEQLPVDKLPTSQQSVFTSGTKDIDTNNTDKRKIEPSLMASPTGTTTATLNTLGTAESITAPANTELDESNQRAASVQLKDAKLAVTLESSPEVATFNLDDEIETEFKPVEFKPASVTISPTQSQVSRQDISQIQLSLRQGVETQNQMQEMIQRFSPVMKQQLITMVSNGIQHAEIRLDPPELGHMTVKIQVHGDQTQVQFHVTQSQTREMVEQAIPRLRELLQEQGMQLADSHVSQGDQGQGRDSGFGENSGSSGTNVDEYSAEELDLGLNQATSLNSGIDYYA